DISSRIFSLTQKDGSGGVCVLSAIGTISSVTLYQAASSGGTATYEGQFDILSLRGSFLLSEGGGGGGSQKSRTGGLSILLTGSDGRILGGCVAGSLIAGSPVQVIAGSFRSGIINKEGKVSSTAADARPLNMNLSGGGEDGGGGGGSSSGGSPS
ncbi:hypothetical protein M569_14473, partial [Genlisea aurea]